ncbi:hypothetical protein KP509_04G043900 [Ceratopteris richardii]|uniref:Bidirectional sugar transporter SWEET n=1 Tax=Ceratopteris richardii TaxID=49495 RepID=A0A8T2V4B8_CERRI|nr:hypothetical protein KP509_04G043900 [Ceratopteris richardii]
MDLSLHSILGISGNIVTVIFFMVATLNSTWMIWKHKDSKMNPVSSWMNQLFVFMLFNCMLWVFYGLPINRPHNFWVILTNAIGSSLALTAIASFYCHASRMQKLIIEWELEAFLSLFVIMILLTVMVNTEALIRILIAGSLAAGFSSFMHLVLLVDMGIAWKKNDMQRLQLVPSIAAFSKGALWLGYGWVGRDLFIIIPNALAVVTGITQLLCWLSIQCLFNKAELEIAENCTPAIMERPTRMASASQPGPSMPDVVQKEPAFITLWIDRSLSNEFK